MGMTLWVETLIDGEYARDSDDHSFMLQYADELDSACHDQGFTPLSQFFDYSEIENAFADEFDDFDEADEMEDTAESASQTPESVLEMNWSSAKIGLETFEFLLEAIKNEEIESLDEGYLDELIEELESAMLKLKPALAANGLFHLAVIE